MWCPPPLQILWIFSREFLNRGVHFCLFLPLCLLITSNLRCVHPPRNLSFHRCTLGEGCTLRYLLTVRVLCLKMGKSAPPYLKTFAKKCTCNPNIVKSSFAFFWIKRQTRTWWLTTLKKKNFRTTRQLVTLNAASYCDSYGYSGDSFQNTRHPLITPKPCILLRMWILQCLFTRHPLVTF